jgi:hypothetical protein
VLEVTEVRISLKVIISYNNEIRFKRSAKFEGVKLISSSPGVYRPFVASMKLIDLMLGWECGPQCTSTHFKVRGPERNVFRTDSDMKQPSLKKLEGYGW